MKTGQTNNLLNRYYNGETSLEEEAELKKQITELGEFSPEDDVFEFYKSESEIPEGLENDIFKTIQTKENHRRTITRRFYSFISAAAVIIIVLGVYLNFRDKKMKEMESSFFVMEQAMYQVSETLNPEEPDDMLVLWVDDNVEIIIN